MAPKDKTLSGIPLEMKAIIFELCLASADPVRVWTPVPALIAALRPHSDPSMYKQALEIFYTKNAFELSIHNDHHLT